MDHSTDGDISKWYYRDVPLWAKLLHAITLIVYVALPKLVPLIFGYELFGYQGFIWFVGILVVTAFFGITYKKAFFGRNLGHSVVFEKVEDSDAKFEKRFKDVRKPK